MQAIAAAPENFDVPWYWPFTGRRQVETAWRSGLSLHEAVNAAKPGLVQFAPQEQLPPDEAYEAFIWRTGTVPTRDNLHDFFNGLVWLAFPETKRRLNELQAAEIARRGIASTRGRTRAYAWGRSAAREVGKVLSIDDVQIDRCDPACAEPPGPASSLRPMS